MSEQPHIIVVGNPVTGLEFIGPFKDADAAINFGNEDGDMPDGDWWIAPIELIPAEAATFTRALRRIADRIDSALDDNKKDVATKR